MKHFKIILTVLGHALPLSFLFYYDWKLGSVITCLVAVNIAMWLRSFAVTYKRFNIKIESIKEILKETKNALINEAKNYHTNITNLFDANTSKIAEDLVDLDNEIKGKLTVIKRSITINHNSSLKFIKEVDAYQKFDSKKLWAVVYQNMQNKLAEDPNKCPHCYSSETLEEVIKSVGEEFINTGYICIHCGKAVYTLEKKKKLKDKK